MNDVILQVKNLSFSYGDKVILNNVSFELARGQFMLINGSSGVGKSTLLRLISKLEPISNNTSLIFDGDDYSKYNEKKLEKIRFQMPLMEQNMSLSYGIDKPIMSSIIELARLRHIDTKINLETSAKKMAIDLGLSNGIWYKNITQLSGGELARLTFIRFFLLNSRLYIIDEGESGLDDDNLDRLMKLVELRLDSGVSFIWVSHRNAFNINKKLIKKIIKDNCLLVVDN